MSLLNFIASSSIFYIAAFLFILFYGIGILIIFVRDSFVHPTRFSNSNLLIDLLVQIASPLFAFLLASIAIMIVSSRDGIERALQNETDSVVDIVLLSTNLPRDVQEKVQDQLKKYLVCLKNEEWKSLSQGKIPHEGRLHISKVLSDLYTYFNTNPPTLYSTQSLIQTLQNLNDARRDRAEFSVKRLHPYMWGILFIDAIISMIIIIFFLAKKVPGQQFSIFLLSISFSLIFSILIGFNNPFLGSLRIKPESIDDSLTVIDVIISQNKTSPL